MPATSTDCREIDDALKDWQQGDVILGDSLPFVHIADLNAPLVAASIAEAAEGFEADSNLTTMSVPVQGLVIISQTCDLVRTCADRPFVQVAALEELDAVSLAHAASGAMPRMLLVPGVADRGLVANLDQLMTLEKSIVANVPREAVIRGLSTDEQIRRFAEGLSRKFCRFAFPEDFVAGVGPIRERVLQKVRRAASDDGKALAKIDQIRVAAIPSWESDEPDIQFIFIPKKGVALDEATTLTIEKLVGRFRNTGRYINPSYRIVSLAELSAEAYLSSEPLDLSYLSNERR